MTDYQALVAPTLDGLAGVLADADEAWDRPSLCERWLVRHVVAHVTMPVRLTPEQFGAEMAAARGDFTVLSDTVALRDGDLPTSELLSQLRSPELHAWEPPGGGATGALTHAVIHSLDITLPLELPPAAPPAALEAVLTLLVDSQGSWFGVDPADVPTAGDPGQRVALLAGRRLVRPVG